MTERRGENTRERVRELLAQGLSASEIAERLNITRQTVYHHLKRLRDETPPPPQENVKSNKVVELATRQKGTPRGLSSPKGRRGRPIEHGRYSTQVLALLGAGPDELANLPEDVDLDEQIRIAQGMIQRAARLGNEQGVLLWQDHLRKLVLAKAAVGGNEKKGIADLLREVAGEGA